METTINSILGLLYEHRYIFSFLAGLVEGAYSFVLLGVLLKFGYFNFWYLTCLMILGYFLNSIIYYLLGYWGGEKIIDKFIKRFRITRKLLDKIEIHFKKHNIKTIFITRILYGISIPVLLIAGAFKMKKKDFLIASFFASIVWVLIVLVVGYGLGTGYEVIGTAVKKIAEGLTIIAIIILVLLSILIIYWLKKITKLKFIKNLENHKFAFFRKIGKVINNGKNK